MSLRVVTTCSRDQWEKYGRKMAGSFIEHWPKEARLTVYGDEYFDIPVNVEWRAMPKWFKEWKLRHADNADAHGMATGRYNYRRDCVKFAHKIAALTDIATECTSGLLIWMDIDTVTDKQVTEPWLCSLFQGDGYMAWLDRENYYPECGFMMFRPWHPAHVQFMDMMKCFYESGAVFGARETHDSYIIQQMVILAVRDGDMSEPVSLSGKHRTKRHPFVYSELGRRMDHMKGPRKLRGASPERPRV